MKKIGFLTAVVFTVLSLVFSLAGCSLFGEKEPAVGSLSNVGNESFEGQISEQTYENVDEAAKAFLKNEVDGKSTETNFVSYTKKQDITKEEIDKLPLGDVNADEITAAESGTITYEYEVVGGSVSSADVSQTRTITIYLLFVGDRCYYFVPDARNGEALTDSYFKDLYNPEHFLNCTFNSTVKMDMDMSDATHKANASIDITMELKLGETAMYAKANVATSASGDDAEQFSAQLEQSFRAFKALQEGMYVVERDGKLLGCIKDGETWNVRTMYGYDTLSEYFLNSAQQDSAFKDYSYFVKTNKGFKLDPVKCNLFAKNYNPIFSAAGDLTVSVDCTVENKRITRDVREITLSCALQGINMKVKATGDSKYSDYGTTQVELPSDLVDYLDTMGY